MRTPAAIIEKFVNQRWSNINFRCSKKGQAYGKNKCYQGISVEFSKEEFKAWCLKQKSNILSLKKPSIDRIDSSKNYSLENIRVIELKDNISRKRYGGTYVNGSKSKSLRGIRKVGKKYAARIWIDGKVIHIGMFFTESEAYEAYRNRFFEAHNKYPW